MASGLQSQRQCLEAVLQASAAGPSQVALRRAQLSPGATFPPRAASGLWQHSNLCPATAELPAERKQVRAVEARFLRLAPQLWQVQLQAQGPQAKSCQSCRRSSCPHRPLEQDAAQRPRRKTRTWTLPASAAEATSSQPQTAPPMASPWPSPC